MAQVGFTYFRFISDLLPVSSSENVDHAPFYTNKEIDKLIQDTEATFITELESGDRAKAMKRLRVPPLGDKQGTECPDTYVANYSKMDIFWD